MVSQKNKRHVIFCMIYGYRWNRGDTCSPNLRVKRSESSDLPSLLVTNTPNFIDKGRLGGSKCDEYIICKEFDIDLGHVRIRLDEGEELGGVHGCYQVPSVKDCTLDLKIPAGFVLRVVIVDHTLDFGSLDDWIKCSDLICDLDNLSRYGFSEYLRCWGK